MSDLKSAVEPSWTREQVVAAMLNYIGERWQPVLARSIELNLPDYERVRRPDHYWRGPGPQPADFVEFDNPDAPLADSNSDLLRNLSMKRALISEWQENTVLRRWMWDSGGLQPLDLSTFQMEEDWGFLYTLFSFWITDGLTKIWFDTGEHPLSMRGWGLKAVLSEEGLRLENDPAAGFMMS